MTALEICFWLAAGVVGYTYALYPLGVGLLARLFGRPVRLGRPFAGSVSVVVSVYNEEQAIGPRLEELTALLAASGRAGEVLVVCDGCTDTTGTIARSCTTGPVHVLELPANAGKAAALTRGCAEARHDIIVFADARQRWAPDALEKLLRNFADPRVGAVSGDLVVDTGLGVLEGVGLYWRFEKWLRRRESLLHSTVGVTGAICAVRRALFRPIPAGTILDDVYWPLGVVLRGYRVVHEKEARAFDHLPARPRDEFRRKVRTLSGNFQLVSRLPAALLPWRNPIWLQFVSHKVLRLAVPWALLALLALSAMLPGRGSWLFFCLQVAGYALGLAAIWSSARPSRPSSVAASFLTLNAAAWLAFWVWASGKAARSWSKVFYKSGPQGEPGPGMVKARDPGVL
jgi:cellulose synthase/poly-beta-1,6-N-acetylglucosamine synthase-like glycosyltransferase